jgi:hypothetical protein
MKYVSSIVALLLLISFNLFSQTPTETILPKQKGSFYLTWGYHRDQYTKSTIHFKDHISDNYDFTLYHARAKDKVDIHHLIGTPLTVPQYVLHVGYLFNNKKDLGIEFSWDHLKYVVRDNQRMHLKGSIHDMYYDKDTVVTPDFVHFEHTNGNNYAMISLVKRYSFFKTPTDDHKLSAILTGGAGVLIPKTDSRVLGNHNDGPFRYSGVVFGVSAGVRYNIIKYLYVEGSMKGAFADYTNAKVYLQGRARHHFFSVQYIAAAGINIPL